MGVRAADVKRRLEAMGFLWEAATGGGSHFKVKRDGQRTVPVTLHNGLKEELDDRYLRLLARQLKVSFEALRHGD